MYPGLRSGRSVSMDVGRAFEKVARARRAAVTRTCGALQAVSTFLAAVMRFLGKISRSMALRFESATSRLERFARWSRAKQMGVPLGADLAGEEWGEPELLPVAVTPPPIPPAAFFQSPGAPPDEDWAAVIAAAKIGSPPTPAPAVPPTDEWEAAVQAARRSAALAAKSATPAPTPVAERAPAKSATPTANRVTAKSATPAAVRAPAKRSAAGPAPQVTLVGDGSAPNAAARPLGPTVDPHVAAATRKAVASAMRMPT
jgi:hypothetical protein